MAYPTAAEIRADLAALAAAYPFCTVMTLKSSVNGTDITALKISKVTDGKRTKVLFTGGMHANELAPPKAILSCITALLDAYKPPGKGISYGAFSLTAQDVKDIIEHVDVYAAPMMNPDGYALALSLGPGTSKGELAGRKNASPTATCALPSRPGVNLNRNCDIVWNFQKLYAPSANVATSSDPCHYNYSGITLGPLIGTPFSEPEAQNVKKLLDEGIEFYVDCHMYGPTVLHSWGIGTNQTTDSSMTFNNPAYDGIRRGTAPPPPPAVTYDEYIPPKELTEVANIASMMSKAVKDGTDVPGRAVYPYADYQPQPGALLYPTSGSADDYAYSRHFVNASLPFVRAFTVECGNAANTGFRPTAAQYTFVEQELHCALLSLLKFAAVWIGKQQAASSSNSDCPLMLLLGAMHPAVELLRHLRDVALRETLIGSRVADAIVRAYGALAPPVAHWLAPRPRLRLVIRRLLAEPLLAVLRWCSIHALRLRSPTLRTTALLLSLAITGALPFAALLAILIGATRG